MKIILIGKIQKKQIKIEIKKEIYQKEKKNLKKMQKVKEKQEKEKKN